MTPSTSTHSYMSSLIATPLRLTAVLIAASLAPLAASAQLSVRSNLVEEHQASAGTRYSGVVVIANASGRAELARLSQTDYRFDADGTTHFDAGASSPRSNARWISLQTSQVLVPAQGKVSVPYTVEVPAVDTLRGTYWSALLVESAGQGADGVSGVAGVQLGAVTRYAVQVATHVGVTSARTVRFGTPVVTAVAEGHQALVVDVLHTGERGTRPVLWVELYDATGALRARSRHTRGLLYPGTSLRQQFDLGQLAAGTYKAVIFADSGDDAVVAMQFRFVI